jgi:hypothetical protein
MNKYLVNILIGAFCWSGMSACASPKDEAKEIVDIIYKVNNYWQTQNPEHGRSFWTMQLTIVVTWKRSF